MFQKPKSQKTAVERFSPRLLGRAKNDPLLLKSAFSPIFALTKIGSGEEGVAKIIQLKKQMQVNSICNDFVSFELRMPCSASFP